MIRVLFVCLGNICRSPTAEGVFRDLVRREGLHDHIGTDSCGTGGWHVGNPPDSRAVAESERRGIRLDDLRARQVRERDFGDFQYLLAMDRRNLASLQGMAPKPHLNKVHLMMDFAPELGISEVPDPYYGGPDGFRDVFDMIDAASKGLLDDIRTKHLDAG